MDVSTFMCRCVARAQAALVTQAARLQDRRGQGTVEYVGMIAMVALLVGSIVAASKGWGGSLAGELKKALDAAFEKVNLLKG